MKNPKKPQLNQDLNELLDLLHLVPPRDPNMANGGREKFLVQAASIRETRYTDVPAAVSTKTEKSHIGRMQAIFQVFHRVVRFPILKPLIAVLVSLSLIFSGTGVAVAAAQDSLPGDFLYPLKTLSEDIRLALSIRTQTRLSLEQEFSNRRVGEIVTLGSHNKTIPQSVVIRLQYQMDQTLKLTAGLDESKMIPVLERIRANVQQHLQQMAQFAPSADPALEQARMRIQEQLRLVNLGLSDPQGFQEQVQECLHNREKQPVIPATPGQLMISPEPTGPDPLHTHTPGSGNEPGPMVGTATGVPVQNNLGPGPDSMDAGGTPEPGGGTEHGYGQGTSTPGQIDGSDLGPLTTATQVPGDGQSPLQPTHTPQDGGGNNSGPIPTRTCTHEQDEFGSGTGPMDPTQTPNSQEMGGGGGEQP